MPEWTRNKGRRSRYIISNNYNTWCIEFSQSREGDEFNTFGGAIVPFQIWISGLLLVEFVISETYRFLVSFGLHCGWAPWNYAFPFLLSVSFGAGQDDFFRNFRNSELLRHADFMNVFDWNLYTFFWNIRLPHCLTEPLSPCSLSGRGISFAHLSPARSLQLTVIWFEVWWWWW